MSETNAPLSQPLGFRITHSRHFPGWLSAQSASLAFSTYESGELFLIGTQDTGEISIFERQFTRCMGLWSDSQTLLLASVYQLWRMENALQAGTYDDGFDRLYVPRVGYTTGDVDVHDVAMESDGRIVFVSTLASCLATVSDRFNFEPIWHPPFISKIATEDRCHLNGLAIADGKVKYVTACGQSDVVDGWRDSRHDGGCVIDVTTDEILVSSLSMPHSPRFHDGKLWLLDSGNGYLGFVDLKSGKFERVTFCPGYARGLCFAGNYAVVGLSQARQNLSFQGLALDAELEKRSAKARCGLIVVDLQTGDIAHWIRIEGNIKELYDVIALPEVRRPKALGFVREDIHHHIRIRPESGQSSTEM